jgi:hypothetical protein
MLFVGHSGQAVMSFRQICAGLHEDYYNGSQVMR